MAEQRNLSRVREVVGVFQTARDLENAIDALLESGFDRADISLLASENAIEAQLGHRYEKTRDLEDDPQAPRAAYVATETIGAAEGALLSIPLYIGATTAAGIVAAAGGPLTAVIAAAVAVGGGGLWVGSIFAAMIGRHHAEHIEAQVEHGGLLLWVRTWNLEQEENAKATLARFAAADVHAHEMLPGRVTATRTFKTPEAVGDADSLTREEKIKLLQRFEYDAREIEVAAAEGMGGQDTDLLDRVLKALHALGAGPELEQTPPTKQGGV